MRINNIAGILRHCVLEPHLGCHNSVIYPIFESYMATWAAYCQRHTKEGGVTKGRHFWRDVGEGLRGRYIGITGRGDFFTFLVIRGCWPRPGARQAAAAAAPWLKQVVSWLTNNLHWLWSFLFGLMPSTSKHGDKASLPPSHTAPGEVGDLPPPHTLTRRGDKASLQDAGLIGLTFNREHGGGLCLPRRVGGTAGEGAGVLGVCQLNVQDGRVALHEHLQWQRKFHPD